MQSKHRGTTFLTVMSALIVTKASNTSMVISLPLRQINGPRTSWERSFKILPGAPLAVNDVNNDSTLLPTETVQHFIDTAFHQKHLNIGR